MWREYVRMELGFIESLRRRWDVLGIKVSQEAMGKGPKEPAKEIEGDMDTEGRVSGDREAEPEHMDVDRLDGDEGDSARKEIMEGAIVKSVISSAVEGTCPCPLSFLRAFLSFY